MLLSKYASEQACSQGRTLLEALELTGAQIAQCYGMHPLSEVELVQEDCRCKLIEARMPLGEICWRTWKVLKLLCSNVTGSRNSFAATQVIIQPKTNRWMVNIYLPVPSLMLDPLEDKKS